MTDDSEVARIAEGLTKAQREALCHKPCPSWWQHGPACMPDDRTGIALKRRGLCVASGSAAWPLTPLGISVRSYLQSKGGGA